jgi:hypothetical protein
VRIAAIGIVQKTYSPQVGGRGIGDLAIIVVERPVNKSSSLSRETLVTLSVAMTGFRAMQERHEGAVLVWWMSCSAAGWRLGSFGGHPWLGLAVGAVAGIWPARLVLHEPMAVTAFTVGTMAGIGMFFSNNMARSGSAAVVVAFSALLSLAELLHALHERAQTRRFRRALAARDVARILELWPEAAEGDVPRGLEVLRADPATLDLILARRSALPKSDRWPLSGLMADLALPAARPELRRMLDCGEQEAIAVRGLVAIGDPEDLDLIFAKHNLADTHVAKAAIDLALRHGRRELVEALEVQSGVLAEYRRNALGTR